MARIWVWQEEQAEAFFAEARRVLRSKGVLALPTETFYALSVNPFDPAALARLFTLKERPAAKPVLVLIAGPEMLFQVVREMPAAAPRLMSAFWPGPLTLIFPARVDLPPLLTGGTGTIGLRLPRQDLVCRLMAALGLPLTGTSANRSGREPLTTASQVAREFGDGVDLILDAGPCPGGAPSTIVDVTVSPPRLVRAGAVAASAIKELFAEIKP
ncbi:MAG: L-threonylcarbamoyladenylate synthase [Deltaproteobacteria bacterium]|nr:L-threonylcarbamoyladenylate synthase [Deltaproteobacteria bacterium]